MSTTLREALAGRADEAGAPELDLDALVELGERRLRRRQLGAVLASAAAVLVVIALVIGGASLVGPSKSTGPIDKPSPHPSPTPSHHAAATRPIVYGDGYRGHVVHLGDAVIRTGRSTLHMTVTDDGLVYTRSAGPSVVHRGVARENQVWFSDGTEPDQIGADACGGHLFEREVFSGTAGSLVVWKECTRENRETVVVFDTSSDPAGRLRGVAARVDSRCRLGPRGWAQFCDLRGVVGDHVYWTRAVHRMHRRGHPVVPNYRTEWLRYDVSTGRTLRVSEGQYRSDLRTSRRGLVLGDTWGTGIPTDGIGVTFVVSHGRVVPRAQLSDGTVLDTATSAFVAGRPLHLRLPPTYVDRFVGFNRKAVAQVWSVDSLVLFEWLDDNTVALGVGVNGRDEPKGYNGDILRCNVSTGGCRVRVHGTGEERFVPNLGLPG